MNMPPSINKLERTPQSLTKARRIAPHHGKAAASFRSIKRECADDGVPPDFHAPL
jgi:hypothetical protein